MSTEIVWTDDTWNPTVGCDRVSPGCDRCYALTMAKRLKGMGQEKYQLDGDPRTSGPGFLSHEWPAALDQPLRWTKPRRIFVNSMSDLFHDNISDGFIAAVWFIMGQAVGCIPEQYRGHTFQILTKRHARMRSWLRKWADVGDPAIQPMDPAALRCGRAELIAQAAEVFHAPLVYDWMTGPRYWPTALPDVWLGVSVENQQWADIRIPALLDTPAAVRFLSCEPLLGPVDLGIGDPHAGHESDDVNGYPHARICLTCSPEDLDVEYFRRDCSRPIGIDWVIVGGESGLGARPMHPDWARSLRDECTAAGVAFMFKQAGTVLAREWGAHGKGSDPAEWPESFPREYPHANA